MRAWVQEIFSSWQGEGLWLGCRQIFLRFCQCNLRCTYCDTASSWEKSPSARWGEFPLPNPLELDRILAILAEMDVVAHHSVSLTGGEPLLQGEFLVPLAAGIKKMGGRTYLETNGTLPGLLPPLLPYLDFVSMDWKLPWSTGVETQEAHQEFLASCQGIPLQVKAVCSSQTTVTEVAEMAAKIAKQCPDLPLVLQPDSVEAIPWEHLGYLEAACRRTLREVRIIPQIHKLLHLP